MQTRFYGLKFRGHTQASEAFSSYAANGLTFSRQTALNLQHQHLHKPQPSYPNRVCVYLLRGRDGHSHESSCIKQHHLFFRLASCTEEVATDDAVLVYIFIDSLALIMHCNCKTVTRTGITAFTENWIMMEKAEQTKLFGWQIFWYNHDVFCLKWSDDQCAKTHTHWFSVTKYSVSVLFIV